MDAVFTVPEPRNEPVLTYAPGTAEREAVQRKLSELAAERLDLTMTIDGRQRMGGGDPIDVVQPHKHAHVLGVHPQRDERRRDCRRRRGAARGPVVARPALHRAGGGVPARGRPAGRPWRQTLNAATMLGQSKTVQQAEIDSACELIDFLRFNVHFGHKLLEDQPQSSPGAWNRFDHRPLEGFVYAITAVQLHRDRRQPADCAGVDGQHRGVEAVADAAVRRHFTMRLSRPLACRRESSTW
jgi:1-pyrroline-5-carboxylate dehydrogenase